MNPVELDRISLITSNKAKIRVKILECQGIVKKIRHIK